VEEINGIIRHLDKNGNVYDPQDIYQNSTNPKIIAKYSIVKKEDGQEEYSIEKR